MRNGLKSLRKAKGWTQPETADRMGMSFGGYLKIERGENGLTEETIIRAAEVFGVSPGAVVWDNKIPVVGRVSAGGAIETEWENQSEPLFEIELPFPLGEDAIGFEMTGISMWPRYDEGDVIVVSRHGEALDGLLGFEAVVRTGERDEGGNRYFKRLLRTETPGLYDLESYNAPTMRNQRIAWGAGLIARVPASRFRKLQTRAIKQELRKVRKSTAG